MGRALLLTAAMTAWFVAVFGAFGLLAAASDASSTPLPDTGDLYEDLVEVATRVADTVASPTSQAMLPLIAATAAETARMLHPTAKTSGRAS